MDSSLLTARQTTELRRAIYQYLQPKLDDNAELAASIRNLLDIPQSSNSELVPNYLEKKWCTVLRLQKRILDLENELSSYKALMDRKDSLANLPNDKANWLPAVVLKTFPVATAQVVNSVDIHPTLPLVLAGCSDGALVMWSVAVPDPLIPQKLLPHAHMRGITAVRWSGGKILLNSDGLTPSYLLASCSSDLSIKIWATDDLVHARTLTGHTHTVSAVAFSPVNANILYSVSRDKSVRVWDITAGVCLRVFVGHSEWVRDIDVANVNAHLSMNTILTSPHPPAELGDFLLTCSNDLSARLSHAASATGLALALGHNHVVECCRFLPQLSWPHIDSYIAENPQSFPLIPSNISSHPAYTASLGYKYCITAARDNVIKLWLLPPPTLRPNRPPLPSDSHSTAWHVADLIGHVSWVRSLLVHPNGRFLISSADDKTIRVWDLATFASTGSVECVRVLSAHDGFVNCISFANFELHVSSMDNHAISTAVESNIRCLFVLGSTDNTVRLWLG